MKWILASCLCCLFGRAISQSSPLLLAPDIRVPGDSLRTALVHAIQVFIDDKEKANRENRAVSPADLSATSLLLDEFKGMDQDSFRAQIINLIPLPDSSVLVQCSYTGLQHDSIVLRASFTIQAKKSGNEFLVASPLNYYTRHWKRIRVGNMEISYRDSIDKKQAKWYQELGHLYETKLGRPDQHDIYYVCDNFHDVLQLTGIDYKRAYNGLQYSALGSFENGVSLTVSGQQENGFGFKEGHDLWHDKLHAVVPREKINRPVDEGCAYLYGGSWGMSWKKILADFLLYADQHPAADWMNLYKTNAVFQTGKYPNGIANILNALVIEKIEKDKGFSAVMNLLQCGKREPGDANYFAALEKIAGITPNQFNQTMDRLIAQHRGQRT